MGWGKSQRGGLINVLRQSGWIKKIGKVSMLPNDNGFNLKI